MKNIFIWMPEMFLALAIVFLLGYGVIYSKLEGQLSQQRKITWLSILTLIFTIFMTYDIKDVNVMQGLLGIDGAMLNIAKPIIMLSSIIILLMSLDYYKTSAMTRPLLFEYPLLVLLATLGILLVVSSQDLISLYLSIEIMSLPSYILATIKRNSQFSTEAGIKYFILGAVSSGVILFGCAIIYTLTGETSFQGLTAYLWYANDDIIGLAVGATFIIVALLFKLAAAPFHMWAPDVYEGSPTIITGFFAIVPKIAIFGALINLLFGPFANLFSQLQPLIFISAIFSVLVGSFGAINQTKFKRLIAYSAIGHTGFILLGIATGSLESIQAAYVYIIVYIIMSCNMFALILSVFGSQGSEVNNYISQLSGLSRSNPVLAISFALCLLSIAGIPPLAGFFSKYLIFLSLIEAHFIFFALIAIVASVIASFYYIRIIKWIYFKDSLDFHLKDIATIPAHQTIGSIKSLIIGSTLYFILTFMFYPNPLINFINQVVTSSLI